MLDLSFVVLLASCVLLFSSVKSNERTPLHFGYITTITGSFIAGGGIPAVDLALKLINDRNDILQNYTLGYKSVVDSRCNRTTSLDEFFELINHNVTYVSLLGCGCSPATVPVAEISHYWNIPQLAYAAATNVLTDRSRFKNFFRTLVSFRYIGASLGQLMREFGWRQMSIITQDHSLFTSVTDHLKVIFDNEGWILDIYDTKGQNPLPFFDRAKAKAYRIIHINAYPGIAYQLLCEAYYRGMIGPKYLWIIPMWYNDDWWQSSDESSSKNVSCTDKIMMRVITGTIGVVPDGYLTIQNESIITFSGLTSKMYLDNYTALLQEPRYQHLKALSLSGLAFDGMWALAIGLDIASKKISTGNDSGCEDLPGDLVPLEHFNYTNVKLGCIMRQGFSEINFFGVTGQIKFNHDGSRSDNVILYQQYRMSSDATLIRVKFGTVTVEPLGNIFAFKMGESNSTLWIGGEPPYDGYPEERIDQNHIALIIVYNLAAACGLVFVVACFIFNVVFRKRKLLKLTSHNLNHFIILGSALLYFCVVFYSYSPTSRTAQIVLCNIRVWLFALGYSLCFGVILSKTWRVYYIFNNPKPNKKGIKDWVLLLIVLVVVGIDLVIILIGSAISHSRLTISEVEDSENPQTITNEGRIQNNFVLVCNEQTGTIIWLGVSFGYKGILQVVAIFMAFHTRRVKVKVLNESKEIAAIIYINSIILVLLTVTEFTLASHHNTYAALFGLGLLIEASLFLGLIFIPKIVSLYLDPQGEKIFTNTAVAPSTSHAMTASTSIDHKESPEETIINLRQRVKELEGKLSHIEILTSIMVNVITYFLAVFQFIWLLVLFNTIIYVRETSIL